MKKLLYLVLLVAWTSCSEQVDNNDLEKEHVSNPAQDPNSDYTGTISDESVYNLNSIWTTQDGNKIELPDLMGKIQVITMIYTSCQFACPRIVADVNRIKSEVEKKGLGDKVHFVLVSIDPEVDTPDKLHAFAKEYHMDPNEWMLLNGKDGDVLELAALLGVKYKKTTETDYAHSNIITVLDQQGEIVHQQVGLATDPAQTIEEIESLLRKG